MVLYHSDVLYVHICTSYFFNGLYIFIVLLTTVYIFNYIFSYKIIAYITIKIISICVYAHIKTVKYK